MKLLETSTRTLVSLRLSPLHNGSIVTQIERKKGDRLADVVQLSEQGV